MTPHFGNSNLCNVLYKPKLHLFMKDEQLLNFNGKQHHAWKLHCNVLSFNTIVLNKTVFYDFYWAFKTQTVLYKCFNSEVKLLIQHMRWTF
jgi:hypothetical protein